MAGRPRRQLAAIVEFEKMAARLFYEFHKIIPRAHRDNPVAGEISETWHEVADYSHRLASSLTNLHDQLRTKAGLPRLQFGEHIERLRLASDQESTEVRDTSVLAAEAG